MRWLVVACAGSWLLAGTGCDVEGCNLDTCSSVENAELGLGNAVTELQGATIRGCRNSDCRTRSVAELADAEALDATFPIVLSPDDGAETDPEVQQLVVYADVEDGTVGLQFSWTLTTAAAVKPGDLLSVTITASNGDVLFEGMGATSMVHEYGRDERCKKPACRTAVVGLGE